MTIHLHCILCPNGPGQIPHKVSGKDMQMVVADYLFHVIQEHWEMLELAHTRPDLLQRALLIIKGEVNETG